MRKFLLSVTSSVLLLACAAVPASAAPSQATARYVVALRPGVAVSGVAATYRASKSFTNAASFTGSYTVTEAAKIKADPRIASISIDAKAKVTATTETLAPWNLDRVDQTTKVLDKRFTYTSAGAGVTVYVLDTGIRATHNDFGGRVTAGFDAFDPSANGTTDCNGHGTHVAGTVGGYRYGVAKAVRLVPVRVFDCAGSGDWSQVLAGINWINSQPAGPAIVNMSFDGTASAEIDAAIQVGINQGITYVAAAGNASTNACNVSPARVPAVITVGATDISDTRATFTNYGSCLDVFAPGVGVMSDSTTSNTAYESRSGTSMSSPAVAGIAAQWLSTHPAATPAEVSAAIVANAKPVVLKGLGGIDKTGTTNLLAYSNF